MQQRGQVTWETAASLAALALTIVGYLVGPARWSGDLEARVKNVESAASRIEGKVDQILLQRGTK
jgi:hypothetical protein